MSKRFLFLSVAVFLAACDDVPPHGGDAAVGVDAMLADGGGLLDGGPHASDAAAGDASATADAGAARCSFAVCDPRSPDCSGGSCVLWGAASSCEEIAGSYAAGASCESVMDCAPGLACFQSAEGGVCGRICCPGEAEACTGDDVCAGAGVLVDGTATSWGRCLPPRTCDVLAPEEDCEPGEGCYIVDTFGRTECRVAGAGGAAAPCAAQADCQPGFFCGSTEQCVRICELGGEPCPDGEGRCVAQAHSPEGTGFCSLDMASAR